MTEISKVRVDALRDFTGKVFQKLGVPAEDAEISAEILINADQRGIGSHGIQRLKRYVLELESNSMKPTTEMKVVRETPNTVLFSADNGMGFVAGYRAMQTVIKKALENNVGLAAVRNSNHYGIAGYYAMMALPHDLIGISLTNTRPSMPPTYGTETILGTNPLAIAVPTGKERPVVLDMATSIVTAGKLELHKREDKHMPPKWAVDASGQPADNAAMVIDNILGKKGGGLLPLGGSGEEEGGHKGYGLSFMVDILCGVLAGSKYGSDLYTVIDGVMENRVSHFFGAIKLEAFIEPAVFKGIMDEYIRRLKGSNKQPGQDRIYIHGEKEWEIYDRQREEVAIQADVVAELREVGKGLGVAAKF